MPLTWGQLLTVKAAVKMEIIVKIIKQTQLYLKGEILWRSYWRQLSMIFSMAVFPQIWAH